MQLQQRHYSRFRGSYSSSGSSGTATSSAIFLPKCSRLIPSNWGCVALSKRSGTRLYAASSGEPQQPGSIPSSSSNAASDSSTANAGAAAATSPADAATATAAAGSASATSAPADAVTQARQELSHSWALLRDAAKTAFVPGYKQQAAAAAAAAAAAQRRQPRRYSDLLQQLASDSLPQQQQQQQQDQQDVLSFPDRLGRLFSGQFITEREASRRSSASIAQQQQQADPQLAAVQFEMQQRLQKQEPSAAAPAAPEAAAAAVAASVAAAPEPAAAAASVSVSADGIIDVTPDTSAAAAAADPSSTASADTTTAAAAESAGADFYPAATQVLVVCTWAVFLLQWGQALPDLWGALTGGRLLDAAAAVLLAFPDTPVTQSLCLDLTALQQGQGWSGLLTSGLCNSGFIATWICCAALAKCGRFLEAGTGQLQLLTVFLICTLAASLGHIFAGRCAIGVAGPGAVLGVYTTWSILATQYMRDVVPLRTIYTQGLMLLALLLVVGLLQPAVSAASLLGGMIGGALAVQIAGPCSKALQWCLALPAMGGLLLLKLLIDLVQVVWFGLVFVAAAVWQFAQDVVGTVRRL